LLDGYVLRLDELARSQSIETTFTPTLRFLLIGDFIRLMLVLSFCPCGFAIAEGSS